ncbi:MAG: type II toxin-antitoxin system RelE/ParE family toxin [Chthoniobacterales bacterium]
MVEVRQTEVFVDWLAGLRDRKASARILVLIARLRSGNFGDAKRLSNAVSELRVDYGPGYRIYFTMRGNVLIILLCGGDKRSQTADIAKAERLAEEL